MEPVFCSLLRLRFTFENDDFLDTDCDDMTGGATPTAAAAAAATVVVAVANVVPTLLIHHCSFNC